MANVEGAIGEVVRLDAGLCEDATIERPTAKSGFARQ